jgi:hypothetical protein
MDLNAFSFLEGDPKKSLCDPPVIRSESSKAFSISPKVPKSSNPVSVFGGGLLALDRLRDCLEGSD